MFGLSAQLIFVALVVLILAAAGVVFLLRWRGRSETRAHQQFEAFKEQGLHLPASLHPIIDPDLCIGSLACIRACPEGEILGLVDGTAKLIHGAKCIGHGRCADECPVDAIRLVFGTAERGMDLPALGAHFESSQPGLYVAGELGGMGLIKNAITQGVQVGEYLGRTLSRGQDPSRLDVLIVGAGPAGLGAAAALKTAGLNFKVVDQETMGGTVAHYPRQKLVMTETVQVPGFGRFGKAQMRKEQVIEAFHDLIDKLQLTLEEGTKVEGISGTPGDFTIRSSKGEFRARSVLLAIGRRGTPRRIGVEGEDLDKVAYHLVDPRQYLGKRMLVVGGGDSALESAIMLAEEADGEVAISYRRAAFSRCRPKNLERIQALIDDGLVVPFMGSTVKTIEADAVTLDLSTQEGSVQGREVRLPNDFVIANLGGELPTKFLQRCGIEVQTHHGEDRSSASGQAQEEQERWHRRMELSLFTFGAILTATLFSVGWRYYLTPVELRDVLPLHEALKPSGWWGHGVGVVATAVMLLNFAYAARKRWGFMRRAGRIRTWLTLHLFVGFLSPVVIAFHAAFQSNNLLATVTLVSLLTVVGTGILGRFIWGLVPSTKGRAVELSELRERWERHLERIRSLMGEVTDPVALRSLLAWASREPAATGSLSAAIVALPAEQLRMREGLKRVRPFFPDPDHFKTFATALRHVIRLRLQLGFYRSLRRLLSAWRAFHVVLAVLMILIIAGHIMVSLFLGYGWIFF